MATTVTGPIGATYDAVFDGISATLTRVGGVVGYAETGGAIAPDQKTYVTSGGGVLTMEDLKPGRYTLSLSVPISESTAQTKLWEAAGVIPVDAGDNITLDAFLTANVEPLTPTLVQQAIAARDAAVAAAASAATSSAAAGAASGRLDVGAFAELATKFVYADPGTGQQIAAAGDVVLWRGQGFAYEVLDSGASGADLDYTGSGGVKLVAIIENGTFYLEQLGITDGDDVTNALTAALDRRPARIETLSALSLTTTGVSRNLRVSGVDLPSLVVDLKGSTITKTGTHAYATIRTEGIINFDCHNVTIDCDDLAAVGWYAISNRTEFVGHAVFHDCHARNCLQISSGGGGQAAGFRVAGAMQRAAMLGGAAWDITAQSSVSGKITRGFLAGSNFGLTGDRNFPLLVEVLGADIRRVSPSDDGDGVFAVAEDTATDREKSRLVVRNTYFEDCAKRSVKSQYWNNDVQFNTFAHTVNAPTGSGREEVAFQRGAGVADNNRYIYAGTGRAFLYDARSPDMSGVTTWRKNFVKMNGGSVSIAIFGSEFLAGSGYNSGIIVDDNEIVGGAVANLLRLRPGSRSTGILTTGAVQVIRNRMDELTNSLIQLDRGPSVSGDTSAFFVRFEKLEAAGNINRTGSVPLLSFGSGDPTGANITVLEEVFGENTGLDFVRNIITDQLNGITVFSGQSNYVENTGENPSFSVAQFSTAGSGRERRGSAFSGLIVIDNIRNTYNNNFRGASFSFAGEFGVQAETTTTMDVIGNLDVTQIRVDGITSISAVLEYSVDDGSTWLSMAETRSAATGHAIGDVLVRIKVDITAAAPAASGAAATTLWASLTNINAAFFGNAKFDQLEMLAL